METCSRWARRGWQMAMVNDSTRSSAMSDVFIVLFTFLAHFWLVICKVIPLVICKVILIHTTFVCLVWFPDLPSGWGEKRKERKSLVNNLTPTQIHGISIIIIIDSCKTRNTCNFITHTLNVKPHVHATHSHEILSTTRTYLTFAFSLINTDGWNTAVDPC